MKPNEEVKGMNHSGGVVFFPALRSDLEIITKPNMHGSISYFVKDPKSGEVFEFGEEEYFICRQLDGHSSLSAIQSQFIERFNISLDIDQLNAFIYQLGQSGLLTGDKVKPSSSIMSFLLQLDSQNWKSWNLFNPNRLFSWLSHKLRWCYTRVFIAASVIVFLAAVGVLYNNFFEFLKDLKLFFFPLSIFYIVVVYFLCFNIPAQIVRGMTAIHFGGYADKFGLHLVFDIFPLFFCKYRIWEVRKKSDRNWILFAPAYYAVLAASLGVVCWKMVSPVSALHTLSISIAVIGIVTSIIKLNFLWPTDISQLLSNWLEIPYFRNRAIKVFEAWVLFRPLPEPLTSREKSLFVGYGLLTAVVTFSSVVIVSYLLIKDLLGSLAGTGALICLAVVSVKYRKNSLSFLKETKMIPWLSTIRSDSRYRKKVRLLFWTVSIVVILLFPYPYEAGGPFKLLPLEQIELHTQVSGEIKKVFVRENDFVKKGDLQALIDVREHKKNLDVTRSELEKALADLRLLEKGPKPEEIKKAKELVETAETQLSYSAKEEERLRDLVKEGVISQEVYDNAARKAEVDKKNLDIAKANFELVKSGSRQEQIEAKEAVVRDLQARLKYYKQNVELTELLAPISGRVITPYIETKVGHVLKEGDLFAIYENMGTIQAEIQIPEADVDEVKIGARVKIRPKAYPTRFFYGKVKLIAPSASDTLEGKVVRVITIIPNPEMELRPQMTGEAKIEGGWEPVVIAFTKAIVRFIMVEVWSWFP